MFCPFCGVSLQTVVSYCGSCGRNIQFLRGLQYEGAETSTVADELIQRYFTEGHSYEIIMDLLKTKHKAVIAEEQRGVGQLLGYRAMWQTLKQKHSIVARRDDVMCLMKSLDPAGTANRSSRRFVRRAYCSAGPNDTWHVDGYDKLKPFGIAISACIDGYSRKIMWLKCAKSNNDPLVIALNYINCVTEFRVCPKRLRTDCGTENGIMAALHCVLRSEHTDEFSGSKSHMYGTSTSNQRIESWWSFFRKQRSQFWMDLFADLREKHLFNGCQEHISLLRYCFLGVLQKELDTYRQHWNTHTIRPVHQSRCPSGKPEAMYHVPHRFHGRNCGFPTSSQTVHHLYSLLPARTTHDELQPIFDELRRQRGLAAPLQWESAVENYVLLKDMAGL
ncbi:uncharacterized protein LOC110160159 isoform X2 [Boleophthalmus pectinirostris]|uniref:uncharacterized protein LOC110160159 isoform X2 n=1 Tax=Boleophthalmus pectinirostris TaxID=150288 RepID=UPI00242CB62A|nr:uncharacterized protein LOC110160159 isoform X2 [Boleophthalmus pectinirostris]